MIYYFVGQPGAGKTTLAKALLEVKPECIHIDGDDMRAVFNNVDYSEVGRRKNISLAQDIARFLSAYGFDVVLSLVSPFRDLREELKRSCEVVEVFVHTSEIRGKEKFHVAEYEPPLMNFISLDTTSLSIDDCIDIVLRGVSHVE